MPGVVHAAAAAVCGPSPGRSISSAIWRPRTSPLILSNHAVQLLPEFMVPGCGCRSTRAHQRGGKTDRSALPSPDLSASVDEYVAPASDIEAVLARIFADVTGLDRFGVTTSFFDAGGNSLLAMRLASRAGTAPRCGYRVRDVFEAPTVRGLIAATAGNAPDLPPVMAVVPRPERLPLSSVQRRMWFVNQFDTASSAYNIPLPVRIKGTIDVAAVRVRCSTRSAARGAAHPLIRRTPTARTSRSPTPNRLRHRWTGRSATAGTRRLRPPAKFRRHTDLPLRVRIWQDTAAGITEVLIVAHHIALRRWIRACVIADLTAAYVARTAGAAPGWETAAGAVRRLQPLAATRTGDPGDPASILARNWRTGKPP